MSLLKFRNQKGFTLIEMMIVIAVIAILAAVLIPKSGLVQDAAKESGVEANARTVQAMVEREKARANDAADLRTTLQTKLASIKNPYTGDTGAAVSDDLAFVAAKAVTISKDESLSTGPIKGSIGVVVYAADMKTVIVPFDKSAAPMTKATITVD